MSSPSTPAAPARDEVENAIFKAAVEVALTRGFGKMTISEIAACAGLSKSGLLYHFDSKKKLLTAMLGHFRTLGLASCEARRNFAVTVMIAAAQHPDLLAKIIDRAPAAHSEHFCPTLAIADCLDVDGLLPSPKSSA